MMGETKHGNQHSMVKTYNNVTFVVKFLVAEKTFKKILNCDSGDNGKGINIDLFQKRIAALRRGIFSKIIFFKYEKTGHKLGYKLQMIMKK